MLPLTPRPCSAVSPLWLSDGQKERPFFSVDIKKVPVRNAEISDGADPDSRPARFSYLAVIEGAKFIMGDSSVQVSIPFALIRKCVGFKLCL